MLTRPDTLKGLACLNARWVQQGMARTAHRRIILDMDISEGPVYGEQEGIRLGHRAVHFSSCPTFTNAVY